MSRNTKNRGAAMVIVLCVMAVFLVLSATVLLSGSVTLNTARTNILFERAKAQAVSLSNAFVEDMLMPSKNANSHLAQYVRDEIMKGEAGGWKAYDEAADNRDKAVYTFSMDSTDSGAEQQHQIRIEMYWTGDGLPDETNVVDGKVDSRNIHLFIDVVSTLNQSEFRVHNEFKLDIRENKRGYDKNKDPVKGNYPSEWNWSAVGREGVG